MAEPLEEEIPYHIRVSDLPEDKWKIATNFQIGRLISHVKSEQGSRARFDIDLGKRFADSEARNLRRLVIACAIIGVEQILLFLFLWWWFK